MIVNDLGRFVGQLRYEHLPPPVTDAIKLRILDLLAAGLVGHVLGSASTLMPCLIAGKDATVWGAGIRYDLRDAAMVNSFLAHSTYLDDGSRFTGGHPSSVVIPAAVALAETTGANGRQLIAATVAGYEIFLRLGRAFYPSIVDRGFQSTAALGAVSAAGAAANLLGLDGETSKNALAIASNLGFGLKEALRASSSQPIQVGRACEAGILAAFYAKAGACGADTIVEQGLAKVFADNSKLESITTGLGTEYRVFETYIKAHGGCRGNHAPVDLIQDIVAKNAIVPRDIAEIDIAIDTVTMAADFHEPISGAQAQFSVTFAVAVMLEKGDASVFRYTDDQLADPAVRAMMRRIKMRVDPSLDANYPDKRGAIAEVVLRDGSRFASRIDNAKGEPEFPFTASEIERKFLVLTRDLLGPRSESVVDACRSLEGVSHIGRLVSLLSPEPAAEEFF